MVGEESEDKDDVVSWRTSLQRQKKRRFAKGRQISDRTLAKDGEKRAKRCEKSRGAGGISTKNSSAVRLGKMAGKDEGPREYGRYVLKKVAAAKGSKQSALKRGTSL